MKSGRGGGSRGLPFWTTAMILLLVTSRGTSTPKENEKTAGVLVWDTMSPFVNVVDIRDRADWKPVPADLLSLERDPAAAFSDPAYYGREYSFKGDVVVENGHLTAAFWSGKGRVAIYSKTDSSKKITELIPLQYTKEPTSITNCRILQNTGDEAALEFSFSLRAAEQSVSAVFSFGTTEIVGITPAENMKGISLFSAIEYGVAPDFIGDDLVFDPRQYPSSDTLCIPSENLFLGLLEGKNHMLVITWPKGRQQMTLALNNEGPRPHIIESVDFENDRQSVYLAILEAPGIWHKEEFKPSYLEKDIAIDWTRPFAAKWITQLYEAGVKTTFTFRESKEKIWRGVAGSYSYPVWFRGQDTFYRLSKKIPPNGESIVYFLERKDTPVAVSTPVDIMKQTLGRQACDLILDPVGRRLRSHHRRAEMGVRRACTCGCTEAIQAVFEAGREVENRDYVEGAVDDMVYFVTRHMERINEYQDFAKSMVEFLNLTGRSAVDFKPFLDGMEAVAQELLREYDRQRENIRTLEYAGELARRTKALTRKKDPGNLPAYLDLGKKWRDMGGAQDYLLGQFHAITRKLSQEAGYGCANRPGSVAIAQEIRKRCRQCLRNADGYEIWPNY